MGWSEKYISSCHCTIDFSHFCVFIKEPLQFHGTGFASVRIKCCLSLCSPFFSRKILQYYFLLFEVNYLQLEILSGSWMSITQHLWRVCLSRQLRSSLYSRQVICFYALVSHGFLLPGSSSRF